jgi:hypothetical protein
VWLIIDSFILSYGLVWLGNGSPIIKEN